MPSASNPALGYATRLAHTVVVMGISALMLATTSPVAAEPQAPSREWKPLLSGKGTKPSWWKVDQASPGMQLQIADLKRGPNPQSRHGGMEVATYRLKASGYPTDRSYELWMTWVDGEAQKLNLTVDDDGKLHIVEMNGILLDNLEMTSGKFHKGEPMEFALVSQDFKFRTFAKFIPFPLEARSGTCHIWLELVDPAGYAFAGFGEGFVPGEAVTVISRSNGEVIRNQEVVSADGKLTPNLLLPAAKRWRQKAEWSVQGGTCSVSIPYRWGRSAL